MAIIKVVKKSGKTHTSLKKVLNYVGEKACETHGINCSENYQKVAYEFFETKDYFKKIDGRQYRQSNNINQIAKKINSTAMINELNEAEKLHEEIVKIWQLLKS